MKLMNRRRLRLNEERQGRFYPVYGVVCLLLLLGFGVWHVLLPDRTYSAEEKRALAGAPVLSFTTVTSGRFMDEADDYAADQFPMRAPLMRLRTGITRALGDKESQGVCYARGGSLIQLYEGYDEDLLQRQTDAVTQFLDSHEFRHSLFLLVPTAVSLYPELLPAFTLTEDEYAYRDAFLEGLPDAVIAPDVPRFLEQLKLEGTDLYYRTDHHWTTNAAYRVFTRTAPAAGWKTGRYTSGVVTTDFSGSLVRKSGFTPAKNDAIVIYRSADPDLSVLVIHPSKGTSAGSYYDMEALNGPEKYEVFLGGNEPLVTVQTTADTNDTLLVFKDSFANCFLPFLFESYKSITIVDPRYFAEPLSTLFAQNRYTDVLFLYNVQTLSADTSLSIVLTDE